jgi:6-phosphofructo-2-kinase/fructose-2,6-biphosphatase 4
MDPDEAAKQYLKRIETKIPVFETMNEDELNYVKMINAGRAFFYNNVSFNYLSHRIVFYLTNLHIKFRTTFFVRAGSTTEEDSYKADAPLSEEGRRYARKMAETLLKHREQERLASIEQGGPDVPLRPLTVWTSTRLRTIQTADPLKEMGYKIRHRSEMSQINPGVAEKLSERALRALYPEEVEKHELDPYHHRYPRGEVGSVSIRSEVNRANTPPPVLPRPRRPPRAHHPRARARTKRPPHHRSRERVTRALCLSHALQHDGHPEA